MENQTDFNGDWYKISIPNDGVYGISGSQLFEIGINISEYKSKIIDSNKLNQFDLIITLCGDAKDKCPVLDKKIKHIHWDLKDPAKFQGTDLEVKAHFGYTRDLILNKIKQLKSNLEKGNL